MKSKEFILICIIVVIGLWFVNCSGKTEEDLIREVLEDIGDYAEDRDVMGLMTFISEDYTDQKSRTIDDIQTELEKNLNKYRGIDVTLLDSKITIGEGTAATVETDVELSSGAAKLFRKLAGVASRCYRFQMEWVKEGENWKIKSASWMHITRSELLPGSKK